jgi:hypothetical protein
VGPLLNRQAHKSQQSRGQLCRPDSTGIQTDRQVSSVCFGGVGRETCDGVTSQKQRHASCQVAKPWLGLVCCLCSAALGALYSKSVLCQTGSVSLPFNLCHMGSVSLQPASSGNRDTLLNRPRAAGLDVRQAVVDFHEK